MTVNSTHSHELYLANGSQTVFTFDFKVYSTADIKVFYNYLSEPIDDALYSIVLDNDFAGGSLTYLVAPTIGTVIDISRVITQTQGTAYPVAGPFPASSHERALDKLTMIVQGQERVLQEGTGYVPITGEWVSGKLYRRNQFTNFPDGSVYVCLFEHTSTVTFANDLADGKWELLMTASDSFNAINASASAANALASEEAAELAKDQTEQLIEDATVLLADLETEGDTQIARVITEGDIQVAAVAATGVDGRVPRTSTTGSALLPTGTILQRDVTPTIGALRFNTDDETFEGYNGAEWGGIGGGGLEWGIYTTDQTTEANKGYLIDNSAAIHTITLHGSPDVGDTVAIGDLNGSFETYNLTVSRNSMLIQGLAEDLILNVKNQRVTLVYTGTTDGWVITELEPNLSQFEYMPYVVMHVQDQKPSGTAPGNATANSAIVRTLNTIVKNDIVGASLASNQVSLPAGTYSFESGCSNGGNSASRLMLYNSTTSLPLLLGNGSAGSALFLRGEVTFTSQTSVDIREWSNQAEALGAALSQGTEVFLDLKITKIGNNYAPRLITTDARLQMVAGLDYTGNVLGFDVTKTGANQLTVTKGACKDNTGLVDLYLTANTTVTIPTVANTIYHLFVCRLLDGTMTVKAYTSEAAAAADTGVINAFRWIGYWFTNGSSNCRSGAIKDGVLWWERFTENTINSTTAPPANITTAISLTTFVPCSRVSGLLLGAQGSNGGSVGVGSVSGTHQVLVSFFSTNLSAGDVGEWGNYTLGTAGFMELLTDNIYWGDGTVSSTGTAQLAIHAVRLRR